MARIAPAPGRPLFAVASYAPGRLLVYWDGSGIWAVDPFAAMLHGNKSTAQRFADEWNFVGRDWNDPPATVVRVQ